MRYCLCMHMITRRRLIEFSKKHLKTSTALDTWYRIVKQNEISSFSKLRGVFPSVDKVDNLTVFNIGGNQIRLISAIHYSTQCLYIPHVLTHEVYNKEKWKNHE